MYGKIYDGSRKEKSRMQQDNAFDVDYLHHRPSYPYSLLFFQMGQLAFSTHDFCSIFSLSNKKCVCKIN